MVVFLFSLLYATALILLSDLFLLCKDNMYTFSKIPPKWGILEKVNLLLLKADYSADRFLQVFFQRVYGSGTSEVVRYAFSDVHIVLCLFSIWLFAAIFF